MTKAATFEEGTVGSSFIVRWASVWVVVTIIIDEVMILDI